MQELGVILVVRKLISIRNYNFYNIWQIANNRINIYDIMIDIIRKIHLNIYI